MLIENLKFKVLFLHFLMNFDQFFFNLTIILGGLYSRLKCDLSPFGGIIFEGVILERGYIRGFTVFHANLLEMFGGQDSQNSGKDRKNTVQFYIAKTKMFRILKISEGKRCVSTCLGG